MKRYKSMIFLTLCLMCLFSISVSAQFSLSEHRDPFPGEIPVSKPGSYDKPGATYILVNDISSPASTLFLGKDVTLDLNGYTLTYADGEYDHIPN